MKRFHKNMNAIEFAKLLYNFNRVTLRHILEDSNLYRHCRESQTSHINVTGFKNFQNK
jgi:hypothetical protein